jgi:hypothetical protein
MVNAIVQVGKMDKMVGKRRGRQPYYEEPKTRLNLMITPYARYYLGLLAHLQKVSMSEVIETFARAMAEGNRSMAPLGQGNPRAGSKAMRGQPILHDERKEPLNLCVTPKVKAILKDLAVKGADPGVRPSISYIVERYCRCLVDLYQNVPDPGPRG